MPWPSTSIIEYIIIGLSTFNSMASTTSSTSFLNSDEPQHLAGEAQPTQSLRSPVLPSQQEQDTHSLTHQPYPSCCVRQQAKGRGGQHRRRQQEENISIIQFDYTFMHDPHQAPQRQGRQHTYTILTAMAIESTTGLGLAVLTSKKGYTPHQAAQLHRWIIKHGFTRSVLQSDHETSLMQLVSTVASDLKLPTRVSTPYIIYTHIRVKARWNGSIGTSLTNFVQHDFSGARTSTSNHICCLQSLYPGHYITASSY